MFLQGQCVFGGLWGRAGAGAAVDRNASLTYRNCRSVLARALSPGLVSGPAYVPGGASFNVQGPDRITARYIARFRRGPQVESLSARIISRIFPITFRS